MQETVQFFKVEGAIGIEKPANACALLLYPGGTGESKIRITGVYPPTAQITAEWAEPLTWPGNHSYLKSGGLLSQILAGDINQHSWKGDSDVGYDEWVFRAGLWELSDPTLPTYSNKSPLDAFLLQPGHGVPSTFFPEDSSDRADQAGVTQEAYYLASTAPFCCIADHHPVLLKLPV